MEVTKALAMQYFGLRRLPAKIKAGDNVVSAVVLLLKTNGKEYYAVQGTDVNGNLVIKADFEERYGIAEIRQVYPVVKFTAELEGKPLEDCGRSDMVEWILKAGVKFIPSRTYLEAMDFEELKKLCIRALRFRENELMKYDMNKER